jgi:hypothetical protein
MVPTTRRRTIQLACGIAAGPFLLGVVLLDGATRAGFDPIRHGVSQLTLGERGWSARLAFIACGLLMAAFTAGTRPATGEDSGSAWGSRLLGAAAAGLVIAGVFPTDPALGYPPGLPEGSTVAGGLHQVGGVLLFGGLVGAAIAWGRRSARRARRGRAAYSIVTAALVAATALAAGITYRLIQRGVLATGPAGLLELVSFAVAFAWVVLLAVDLLTER